jgi:hypothetical protein
MMEAKDSPLVLVLGIFKESLQGIPSKFSRFAVEEGVG